jgi:phytoene dehydrogenase-like protein
VAPGTTTARGTDGAKRVVVIGAGIAGLSTGCYLQMNGYQARVYEMHTLPGGLCTSWQRDGYTIDCCIHWLTGSRPGSGFYKLWQEVGLIQGLELIDHDEFARVEFADGPTVILYTDLDRLQKHLLQIAPEDEVVLKELLAAARFMAAHELPSDLPPRELMRPGDMLRVMPRMLRIMPLLKKWNGMTIGAFTARLKNRFVRTALLQIWLPEMSAFVLVGTLAWFHGRQAGYPVGGSLPLARAIEKRFLDLGGAVEYRARVAEILVENDRAMGIRLADGRGEHADYVVSAADLHATVYDMLGGRYVDNTVKAWFNDFVPFPPLVFIGVGVAREFPEVPFSCSGISLGLDEPLRLGGQTVERMEFRIRNYDPTMAPAGKTVITSMLPVDYDYWKELSKDQAAYEAEKETIAAAAVKLLDQRFPGLAAQVEMVDVSTPMTFERYTGNWRGSFEGWQPTPSNLTIEMPKKLPELERLFLAGQWVAPGGGLPSGVMTGRQVTQLICHEDGRRFVTSVP